MSSSRVQMIRSKLRWIANGGDNVSATIQTILVKIAILLTNLLTGVLTARYLGSEGRGEQAAIILFPQLLAFSCSLGLFPALTYYLKREPEKRSEIFSTAVFLAIILGSVSMGIGLLFIPVWLSKYSQSVIMFAQAMMISSPLIMVSVACNVALSANGDFSIGNKANYLIPFLTILGLSMLILLNKLSPYTSSAVYVFPTVPVAIWLIWNQREHIELLPWGVLKKYLQKLLSYGVRSFGSDLLSMVSSQIDQVLVVGLLSATSMGQYSVALSLSRMLEVFQNSIATVLFPRIAACSAKEAGEVSGQAVRAMLVAIIPCAILLASIGPTLLNLLYGREFLGATNVFRILSIEIIISGITIILIQSFLAVGRPEIVTFIQVIGLLVSVPLLMWLVPQYNILGAGISLLISSTIRAIILLICYPVFLQVKSPNLILTMRDVHFIMHRLRGNHAIEVQKIP